jgi:hypothetical protein
MGNKVVQQPKRIGRRQAWSVSLYGHRAVELMRRLQPLMGERRQAKIAELLATWDAVPHKQPRGSGLRTPATCHPDKPNEGNGLCSTCYMRRWRARRREAALA